MKLKLRFFLYTSLLLLAFSYYAGAVYYTRYTSRQSLISNNVYNVYRDSRGYMWFATDKGISRFDGKEFKNYTTLDGIGDNEIFDFYEDKAHRLWLFTYNGSNCYLRNDSVFNADNDPLLKKMPVISFMNAMYSPDDTTLYICYRFGDIIKLSGKQVNRIRQHTLNGELMSAYPIGNVVYAQERDSLFTIDDDRLVNSTSLPYVRKSRYHDGILYVSDETGIGAYKNGELQWKYKDRDMSIDYAINMRGDTKGNVLVSTINGLYIFNPATGHKLALFKGQRISNAAQDIYGNYWVASFGNGVYCINRELDKVDLVRDVQSAMVYNTPSGQLFIRQDSTLYSFRNGQLLKEALPVPFANNCYPLYADDSVLFFLRNTNSSYFYHKQNRNLIPTENCSKWLFVLHDNFVHIGNYGGDILSLKIINGKPERAGKLMLGDKIVHTVYVPFDKSIYLLTENNTLYKLEDRTLKATIVGHVPDYRRVQSISCIGNYIGLLTNTNELVIYNIAAGYKRGIISTGGIALYKLEPLDKDRYLAYTGKGYYILSFSTETFPHIGWQQIEYPFPSRQILNIYPAGNHLLCNVDGNLYKIDKELVNRQLDSPLFTIEKIIVNGKQYHSSNIQVDNASHGDIRLGLSMLHFNNSANSYRYRIHYENDAGQWYTSKDDNLAISIPKHGSYKLEIKAVTENKKTAPSVFLSISLHPPFYYSTWFKIIAALIILSCCIYGVYLYNRRRRRIFQNRLHHLKMEHRAISSLLNPHFTFNAINNIQNLINEKAADKANNYLVILSKLIRQNMENLQFSLVPVDKELELIANYIYLQNLRFDDKIRLVTNNHLSPHCETNIPPLLIHTFVENAVVHGFSKHAADFTIIIDISLSVDDYLIISIRDNGPGLNSTRKNYSHIHNKTSMGIDISKKRLERLSQFYKVRYSINIADINESNVTGVEVIITLYSKFEELAS